MNRFTDIPSSNNAELVKKQVVLNGIDIKTVTWNKISHGLFDYENSYYDMNKFNINQNTTFYRYGSEIIEVKTDIEDINQVLIRRENRLENEAKLIPNVNSQELVKLNNPIQNTEQNEIEPSNQEENQIHVKNENIESLLPAPERILSVICTEDHNNPVRQFIIKIDSKIEESNKEYFPFLIVRSLKGPDGKSQRGYVLKAGDNIRLGRLDFRVLEISTGSGLSNAAELPDNDLNNILPNNIYNCETSNEIFKKKKENGEELLCRYCLMENISEDPLQNLMLFLCTCNEGVHFLCLKNWMQYKIVTKNTSSVTSYQWKKLDCEICLTPWPRKVFYAGKLHELIWIERPTIPYIVFERPSSDSNMFSTISVIYPEENSQLQFGRGHSCQMRITDISVSRVHSILTRTRDKFLLFDNDSKFGTLIHLSESYPISRSKSAVQVGRTVFTLTQRGSVNQTNLTKSTIPGQMVN